MKTGDVVQIVTCGNATYENVSILAVLQTGTSAMPNKVRLTEKKCRGKYYK